jgi:hypothetical protein
MEDHKLEDQRTISNAWIAGVLDAIGVFRLHWNPGTWDFIPSISVKSRNESLIEELVKCAGEVRVVPRRNRKGKDVFVWRLPSESVIYILRSTIGYLDTKKIQAQELLEAAEQRSKRAYAKNIMTP